MHAAPDLATWSGWLPWLTIAALGIFHGVNPAMGWLFAVALGLHRRRRGVVLWSLVPIALGHALAVALAVAAALSLGTLLDRVLLARVGGAVLVGWALWHAVRGHRSSVRVGMQAGMAGLALWSFLMAGMHGAGLMLLPVLVPLCAAPGSPGVDAAQALGPALAVLGVHTAAMLVAIGAVSLVVYDRIGVGFLRTGWINLDRVWTVALLLCGTWLLVA